MSAYTESIRRTGITKTEERKGGHLVRRWFESGNLIRIDVYDPSGPRIGTYKTERGALAAIAKRI